MFPWLVAGAAVGVMTRPQAEAPSVSRLDKLSLDRLSPTIVAEIPQIRPQKINPIAAIAAQMQQAEAAQQNGDLSTASAIYHKALLAAEAEGHRTLQATLHNYLGHLAEQQNQPQQAQQSFQQALDLGKGDRVVTSTALMGLAEAAWRSGDMKAAKALYDRTLPKAKDLGDRTLVAQIETRLQAVNRALKPAPPKQDLAKATPKTSDKAKTTKPKAPAPQAISANIPPVQMLSEERRERPATQMDIRVELQVDPLADVLPPEVAPAASEPEPEPPTDT